jgi:hypothetical protein
MTTNYDKRRLAEDVLAYVGAAQAVFVGTLEAIKSSGFTFGDCEVTTGLPYYNIIILVVLVAPKTLGRATVGKYLDKLPFIGGK